ncbi:MAG TPA: tetratricopeptide repeat protein [Luteitalea sp.]|nr:tetratricopeptide repeat protein [Luteitalea sp.]
MTRACLSLLVVCMMTTAVASAQPVARPKATSPTRTDGSVAPKTPASARSPLMAKANAAREAGELEQAVALYRQVLAATPRSRETLFYLGTSLYELQRWSDARATFDRLVRLDKTNVQALAFRGICTFKLGQYPEALADLTTARAQGIGAHPEIGPAVRFHAGMVLTRLSQFELALNTLAEFALEGNDAPQIIEALGIAALRMPLLSTELPAEKREMVMMAGRASYFMAMRLVPAARTSFEELILRYPDVPNAHYAFGVFLLADDADRALKEFERELAIQPGHAASHIQMAYEYLKRGDHAAARPHAERAVTLAPTDFVTHRLMGQVQLEQGQVEAAITSLEQSRTLEPKSPMVHFTLAKAYARAGRDAEAEKARAEFTRLDRLSRLQRNGSTALGGITP